MPLGGSDFRFQMQMADMGMMVKKLFTMFQEVQRAHNTMADVVADLQKSVNSIDNRLMRVENTLCRMLKKEDCDGCYVECVHTKEKVVPLHAEREGSAS